MLISFDIGVKNLGYCILNKAQEIQYWEVIDLETTDETESCIALVKAFDSRPHMLDIDTVLIEKQPSFNPKMKTISHIVQSYYIIRKMTDNEDALDIIFTHPKHKLKAYNGPVVEVKCKTKYNRTKRLGIEYTKRMVTGKWLEYFNKLKKKDDAADSYLQGIYYLKYQIKRVTKFKKVTCSRKPTVRQEKRYYSLPNLKYLLEQKCRDSKEGKILSLESQNLSQFLTHIIENDKKLKKSYKIHFKNYNNPMDLLIENVISSKYHCANY